MDSDNDMPNLSDDDRDSDWEETNYFETKVACLFCPVEHFASVDLAIEHLTLVHEFNLFNLKFKFGMDCYSYIKMINYIRKHKPDPKQFTNSEQLFWHDDVYLKPVIEADPWLMFDFEDLIKTKWHDYSYGDENDYDNKKKISIPDSQYKNMLAAINALKDELIEKDSLLKLAMEDMKKMSAVTQNLVEDKSGGSCSIFPEEAVERCVGDLHLDDDQGYFSSYAHYGIHYEMLSDKIRTEAYRAAILHNHAIFDNAKVLDVGCGTGILSMFAASAGAERVYAVDMSDVIYQAMDIIRENNFTNKITTLKGRLEDLDIPEKVDLIISEWMGYFLLFEGMLDSVIYARDNHLKPGGKLLPNRCNISIVGNGDTENHNNLIEFWSDVYGFKMNCMKTEVVKESSIDIVKKDYLLTSPFVLTDIDINTCTIDCVNFNSDFLLVVKKDGQLTSLVGYFDTFFDLPSPVQFSTGPFSEATHWKQTVFHFRDPKSVKEGDVIKGSFHCSRDVKNVRGLIVIINIFDQSHKYIVS